MSNPTKYQEEFLRQMFELTSKVTDFNLPEKPLTMTALRVQERNKPTLTVDKVPDWLSSGDLIERRGKRTFAVKIGGSIPRWRKWLRAIERLWR